jgi:hypothetical protein
MDQGLQIPDLNRLVLSGKKKFHVTWSDSFPVQSRQRQGFDECA